jgi:hypothetical protein
MPASLDGKVAFGHQPMLITRNWLHKAELAS